MIDDGREFFVPPFIFGIRLHDLNRAPAVVEQGSVEVDHDLRPREHGRVSHDHPVDHFQDRAGTVDHVIRTVGLGLLGHGDLVFFCWRIPTRCVSDLAHLIMFSVNGQLVAARDCIRRSEADKK